VGRGDRVVLYHSAINTCVAYLRSLVRFFVVESVLHPTLPCGSIPHLPEYFILDPPVVDLAPLCLESTAIKIQSMRERSC